MYRAMPTSQETGSRIFLSSSVTATVFPVKERTSGTTDKYITIEPIMIITLRAGVEDLKCLYDNINDKHTLHSSLTCYACNKS